MKAIRTSVFALSLLSSAVSYAQTEPADTPFEDAMITGQLISTYTLNEYLNPFDISVDTEQGVVTLSGEVESVVERQLAIELAQSVDGVTRVEDQLQVVPELERNDTSNGFAGTVKNATTTAKIKSQLLWNSETDGLDIQINTRNGVVTLDGTVGSEVEAAMAEQIARNTKGVKSVTSNLIIDPNSDQGLVEQTSAAAKETAKAVKETAVEVGESVQDTWITTKVKSLMVFDRRFEDTDIDVNTQDGTVLLTGTVAAATKERELVNAVQNIKGVKDVNADLHTLQ